MGFFVTNNHKFEGFNYFNYMRNLQNSIAVFPYGKKGLIGPFFAENKQEIL